MKYSLFFLILNFFSACHAQEAAKQPVNTISELSLKADSAFAYCKQNKMDTTFCLLVDMKIHSGKYRLFVWDFAKKEVVRTSLCCHGIGGGSTNASPVFSNKPGSYCTSLGKYRIGTRAYSQYGIHVHYKLHGLEASNSNAFKRIVVLHSHTPVPDYETYPQHLPLGWSLGCAVVSNTTMTYLDNQLKNNDRKILLWIYN